MCLLLSYYPQLQIYPLFASIWDRILQTPLRPCHLDPVRLPLIQVPEGDRRLIEWKNLDLFLCASHPLPSLQQSTHLMPCLLLASELILGLQFSQHF